MSLGSGAPPFGSQRSDPPPKEGVLHILKPWQRLNSLPICPCLYKYIDIYDWRTSLWVPEVGPAAVRGCVADHEALAALQLTTYMSRPIKIHRYI